MDLNRTCATCGILAILFSKEQTDREWLAYKCTAGHVTAYSRGSDGLWQGPYVVGAGNPQVYPPVFNTL